MPRWTKGHIDLVGYIGYHLLDTSGEIYSLQTPHYHFGGEILFGTFFFGEVWSTLSPWGAVDHVGGRWWNSRNAHRDSFQRAQGGSMCLHLRLASTLFMLRSVLCFSFWQPSKMKLWSWQSLFQTRPPEVAREGMNRILQNLASPTQEFPSLFSTNEFLN